MEFYRQNDKGVVILVEAFFDRQNESRANA